MRLRKDMNPLAPAFQRMSSNPFAFAGFKVGDARRAPRDAAAFGRGRTVGGSQKPSVGPVRRSWARAFVSQESRRLLFARCGTWRLVGRACAGANHAVVFVCARHDPHASGCSELMARAPSAAGNLAPGSSEGDRSVLARGRPSFVRARAEGGPPEGNSSHV